MPSANFSYDHELYSSMDKMKEQAELYKAAKIMVNRKYETVKCEVEFARDTGSRVRVQLSGNGDLERAVRDFVIIIGRKPEHADSTSVGIMDKITLEEY